MNLYRIRLLFILILFSGFAAAQDTLVITNQETGLNQRIAYDDIITVQPDRSNDRAKIVVGPTYATIVAIDSYDDVVNYQNCRLLPFTNRISGVRTAIPYSHVDTVLNVAAAGGASINASESRFGYAAMFTTTEQYQSVFAKYYECDQIAGRSVYELINVGYGRPIGKGVVDGKAVLKSLVAGTGVTIDEQATTLVINSTGGGGGDGGSLPTDLTVVQGANSATISSSTGQDAPLLSVNTTRAGLMLPAQNDKLEGVEAGATADQTGAEMVTAIDAQLGNTDWQTGGAAQDNDLQFLARSTDGVMQIARGADAIIPSVGTSAGLMLPADKTKLDGIESGATADQTPAELVIGINTAIGNTDWQSGGGGSGTTNLSYSPSPTNGTVTSSTGTAATIPVAGATNSGLFTPSEKTKLAGIEENATADQGAPEIRDLLQGLSGTDRLSVTAIKDIPVVVEHVKQTTNKAMIHAEPGSTTYSVSGGVGTLSIDDFGDISHASIIVDKSTDALNGAFTLNIDFVDNSVNTWDVSGGVDFTQHDLYVPQFRFFDVGATALMIAELGDKSSDQTNGVFPSTISWSAGVLSITFASGTSFDSISQMLIELNFPKTR